MMPGTLLRMRLAGQRDRVVLFFPSARIGTRIHAQRRARRFEACRRLLQQHLNWRKGCTVVVRVVAPKSQSGLSSVHVSWRPGRPLCPTTAAGAVNHSSMHAFLAWPHLGEEANPYPKVRGQALGLESRACKYPPEVKMIRITYERRRAARCSKYNVSTRPKYCWPSPGCPVKLPMSGNVGTNSTGGTLISNRARDGC